MDFCPQQPPARAALGCALAREGRFAEAAVHLHAAVAANPFDRSAARAFVQVLTDLGDRVSLDRGTESLRKLSEAAPHLFPPESWFAPGPQQGLLGRRPTGSELVSIVILCSNEVDVTRLCLESVLAHTRRPYELVLIDNGSSDETPTTLHAYARRDGPERVTVVRNEKNRGHPAGVNQGLSAVRGEFVVLLNNDVVVTSGWLDRMVACSLRRWPDVGLVGAVTNYAPPPQLVEPDYGDLSGLHAFAARRAISFAGQAMEVQRLTGFCLLVRRDVFECVGWLDEQFGLGFFDDDDLCLRARRTGFRLAIALDCYVHHFGSRTFRALGVNTSRALEEDLALYRAKWGSEEAARYTLLPARSTTLLSDSLPVLPATPRGKPRVSLTMIVKNEEHHLPDCLESIRDLGHEVVVVDTGSTDRTREVARSFGAVLGEFPWVDDFAAARNAALDRASGDYIFWMDADDRLDEENRQKLRSLLNCLTGKNDAYVVKCLCVGERPGSGAGTVVDHVRLFRNFFATPVELPGPRADPTGPPPDGGRRMLVQCHRPACRLRRSDRPASEAGPRPSTAQAG